MRCGIDWCVNEAHMEAVTQREIQRRTAATKLTLEQVQGLRSLAGQFPQRVIGERFGISQCQVNAIIRGKSWASRTPRKSTWSGAAADDGVALRDATSSCSKFRSR